jgi:hypothetical protein
MSKEHTCTSLLELTLGGVEQVICCYFQLPTAFPIKSSLSGWYVVYFIQSGTILDYLAMPLIS